MHSASWITKLSQSSHLSAFFLGLLSIQFFEVDMSEANYATYRYSIDKSRMAAHFIKKSLKWRHRESGETGSKHQSCLAVFSKICKPSFDQSRPESNKHKVFLHIFHDGRDYSYLKTVKILTILAMQVVKTRSENSTCGVIFWCRILCHIVCVSILPLSVPTCWKSMNFPTIDTFDNR